MFSPFRRRCPTNSLPTNAGADSCQWEAELICSMGVSGVRYDRPAYSSEFDYERRRYRNSANRVRWTRVFDSHYPSGVYSDVMDYLG